MGKILLLQLDGRLPNVALMRIAAHHAGDEVTLRKTWQPRLWDQGWDKVYGSLIFERTRPVALKAKKAHPDMVLGGTGWETASSLEEEGITTKRQDYSIYPGFRQSIGFTQRGCRLKCKFCVVPTKEGAVTEEQTITELWRGPEWPKELILLDNDFFGQDNWRDRIGQIRDGGFKVSFTQGINARMINQESAEAIGSIDYRNDKMDRRQITTAWDSLKDEGRLFKGLESLVSAGVKPRHILVYMLVGYWPGETMEDILYRQGKIREFGAFPYPMPYERTRELVGFQRWVVGAYDKGWRNHPPVPWGDWEAAKYRPENLG